MSTIAQERVIACPYHLARKYLAAIIESQLDTPQTLTLSLAIPGAELLKEVDVSYASAVDPMYFDQPWSVHWSPKAGPYPDFDGELTARADETYSTSKLELKGDYRPPGGGLGAAFDAVVGNRIAAATARALLERLGKQLEAHYAADEQSKASAT